ncbi:PKD domain-containing protein [Saccharicrinis aurantiacus]|uniref:PKD domain-containing protein n=1 Tax=Saccharicrinis aurantiacus TaxID=1849719 RepID=UPI0009F85463|nr:PKD domain-containing protein [Saccharicrinis aurantiacus]
MNLKFLPKKNYAVLVLIFLMATSIATIKAQYYPTSDPTNSEGWILNNEISDEFNGTELNKNKWWILGENGDYRNKWKGRAPGQFAPHNVKVENGELVLTSQWEPDFAFANEMHEGTWYGGSTTAADKSKPITQACILSERFFRYGYLEVRCKAADAPVTNAFWTTGYHSEIDMTENYGKRPIGNPENKPEELERKYRTNMISWDPDKSADYKPWKNEEVLDVRVASDYYVYGFEWGKDEVKIYFNGELLRTKPRTELESTEAWAHNNAQEMWIDSEVFSWYGLPSMQDLANNAGEYKIDYVRLWQKEVEGPYFDALGFEGPFYFQGRSQNWWAANSTPWRMKTDQVAGGDLSLRWKQTAAISSNQTIWSPYGSLDLPSGANTLTFKIWKDASANVNEISFILNKPWAKIDFDISGIETGKWVSLSKTFSRNGASDPSITNGDRIGIQVVSANVSGSNNLFYIDNLEFENQNTPILVPEASFTADATTGKAPLKVQFTDETEGMPTAWEWDFDNDGTIDSNERNPSFTYDTPGNYSVKLTVTNDNGSDTKLIENYIVVDEETSVGKIEDSLVSVYPNPASDYINIDCQYADVVQLYSLSGSLLKEGKLYNSTIRMPINNIQKGVYMLNLLSKNNIIYTKKVVIL